MDDDGGFSLVVPIAKITINTTQLHHQYDYYKTTNVFSDGELQDHTMLHHVSTVRFNCTFVWRFILVVKIATAEFI